MSNTKTPMTSISLTSGELLDIMHVIYQREEMSEDPYLSVYYKNLADKFEILYKKLQELPGEDRETTLVMAL